jgi:hypothetical protein
MSKKSKIFNFAACFGIGCLLVAIVCAAVPMPADAAGGARHFVSLAYSIVYLFSFGASAMIGFALWIRALIYLYLEWGERDASSNFSRLLVCLFLSFFAGYVLHFIGRREKGLD